MRRAVVVAMVAAALAAPSPASAADDCLAVTGTATMPSWFVAMTPGLGVDAVRQSVWMSQWGGGPVASAGAVVSLVCADAAGGEQAFTGQVSFGYEVAPGASFSTEDLASGSGSVSGFSLSGTGVGSDLNGAASVAYVRAGTAVALVVTLHDVVVNQAGVVREWGDVTLTGVSQVQAGPHQVLGDVGQNGRVQRWSVLPHLVVASA